MPAISVSYPDLARLIGKKVPLDQLTDALILNKIEIDNNSGDEWALTVTPDRPDLFSVEGLARQLRGWFGIATGLQPYTVSPPTLTLRVDRSALRPCVAAGIVRNVRLDDATVRSLFSLQETLDLTLGRGRRKAAVGIHDLSAIRWPVTYKDVPSSSRLHPLDGEQEQTLADILRTHPKGRAYAHLLSGAAYPAFVDQEGIISFAPIINSSRTQVTSRTTDLFIEMQGTDQRTLDTILHILVTALADRGGTIESLATVTLDLDAVPHTVSLADINRTLGLSLKSGDVVRLLQRMRYDAVARKETIEALAPAYRADLLHPVDLIEDVAIAYGINAFIPDTPALATVGSSDPLEDFTATVREAMIGLGFTETLNFSLTSPGQTAKALLPPVDPITVANPVSLDYTVLRQNLLPSLLANLSANTHRRYPQHLFEIADVTVRAPTDTGARSVRTLCACSIPSDFSGILSILRAAAGALKLDIALTNNDHPPQPGHPPTAAATPGHPPTAATFIPGRAGTITLNGTAARPPPYRGSDTWPLQSALPRGNLAGFFGEVHPQVLANFGLKQPVAAFELRLE